MDIREKMFELVIEHNSHYAVICDRCLSDTPEEYNSKIYGLIDHLIANGVTIEAEPVKHGRWEEQELPNMDTCYDCSACGESFCFIEGSPKDNLYTYCPYCGADMRGTDNE